MNIASNTKISNSKLGLLMSGIFATCLLAFFYWYQSNVEMTLAKKELQERTERIKTTLDQFVTTAELMGKFIAEDLNGSSYNQMELEKKLNTYINASPRDLIFGIGVWHNPYKFNSKKQFFGPYIHRTQNQNSTTLTYEWNTLEYNYPEQPWFQAGVQSNGPGFFVDPYFDAGLVYVTNSRIFRNKENEVQGVISVDLVIPQLQDIVINASTENKELVLIEDRKGHLLAHPLKNEFFKSKNIEDGKNNESLINYRAKDIFNGLKLDEKKWISSEMIHPDLGWKVQILSSEDHLLANFHKSRLGLLIILTCIWIAIWILWNFITSREKEKAKIDAEIEVSRAQLIQSSKLAALGEMAAGVAHEINNPLAIITGKAQQIEKQLKKVTPPIDEKTFHSLTKIIETSDRISKIISGLKNFSRSAEHDNFQSEKLANIINDSVSLCSERFKNNDVDLKIDTPPNVLLHCRPTQISQVLVNLLSNSFDAVSLLETKWVHVSFSLSPAADEITIAITDSGHGIPDVIREKMMQPFFTTKEVGKGTGLGLSISKGIIENHRGQLIYGEDSPHTQFKIILPATRSFSG